jgi:uncharacterized membrane protein YeaQ/YmgE (transglycosylase-associated protein family)
MLPLLHSLLWLLIGLLIGALAKVAKLQPTTRKCSDWPAMLALGALAALCAGWLGTFLLGNLFAIPTALWISILCVALFSRLITRGQIKLPDHTLYSENG